MTACRDPSPSLLKSKPHADHGEARYGSATYLTACEPFPEPRPNKPRNLAILDSPEDKIKKN